MIKIFSHCRNWFFFYWCKFCSPTRFMLCMMLDVDNFPWLLLNGFSVSSITHLFAISRWILCQIPLICMDFSSSYGVHFWFIFQLRIIVSLYCLALSYSCVTPLGNKQGGDRKASLNRLNGNHWQCFQGGNFLLSEIGENDNWRDMLKAGRTHQFLSHLFTVFWWKLSSILNELTVLWL